MLYWFALLDSFIFPFSITGAGSAGSEELLISAGFGGSLLFIPGVSEVCAEPVDSLLQLAQPKLLRELDQRD